jgi:hypothetical protein
VDIWAFTEAVVAAKAGCGRSASTAQPATPEPVDVNTKANANNAAVRTRTEAGFAAAGSRLGRELPASSAALGDSQVHATVRRN